MDVYIPLIFYIILISSFFRKKKTIAILLTIIPLILFWGTKVDLGSDYGNYLYKYEIQHDMPVYYFLMDALEGKFEPGFFFFLKIMPSFNAAVFVTSLFLILSVFIFFNEFVPKHSIYLALFLWLFNSSIFNMFSAMRSSFVIGFFLLAIIAKTRSFNVAAIVLSLIGAQFHMSGYILVLFFLLPFDFFHKHKAVLSKLVFVFIFIALLLPSFFSDILNRVLGSSENLSVYSDYVTDTNYGLGFYLFSIFRICFIIYILSLIKRELIEKKYIWIAWITILFYMCMMIQGIEIMYRFCNYLFLITVAFKCYVLKIDKSLTSKAYLVLSLVYALNNFNNFLHSEQMPFYQTYHSFLFQ